MKKLLFLLLILCCQFVGFESQGQSFYETQFKSNDILYDVLVIYYDDNDLVVRTRYKLGDVYKVAEFNATAQVVQLDDGSDCYLIDGGDAKIVYGDGSRGYSADNYLFYKDANGEWGKPYVIDDEGWTSDDPDSHMFQTNYWKQIDPSETFTEQYVYNFYDRNEAMYNTLLAYNPNNVTNVAGVNGSGHGNTDGEWKVFMSKGTGFGVQSWVTRYKFPKDEIKKYWDEGKSITSMSYGNGLWMVTMSKNSGLGLQSYNYGASWPTEWIKKKWDAGRRITEMTYGNGQWAFAMSENSGYSDQVYSVSKEWPREFLDKYWKNDSYSITSIAYGAGHWAVVLSRTPGQNPGQRIRAGAEFPSDDVSECWSEGYDVTTMAYGDEWVVILTKGFDLVQSYDEGTAFPKSFVSEKWDAGYAISDAIYTYVETGGNSVLNFTGTASTGGSTNNTIASNPSYQHTNTNPSTTSTVNNGSINAVPRLHLIVAANTKVADIGVSCAVDRNNTVDEFTDYADGLGIKLKKYMVDGENLSKANLRSTIQNMDVKPNDVVVFVYSGHGFRWSDQTNRYPMMALFYSRFESPSNSNSYSLQDVYNLIVAKGARLNIVLGDCCNNDIGVTSREGGGGLASRSFTRGDPDRLRKLFFEARGNIIAAAAQPDETACGSSVGGGYFLNAFFSAIDKEISLTASGTPSWDAILSRSMKSATYKTQNLRGCSVQHGVFKNGTR